VSPLGALGLLAALAFAATANAHATHISVPVKNHNVCLTEPPSAIGFPPDSLSELVVTRVDGRPMSGTPAVPGRWI
jgi:hypothetical protein